MPKVNKSICIGTTIAVLVLLFMLARRVKEDFKVNVIPPDAKFSVKKLELSMKSPGTGKGKVTSVVTDETDGMKSAVGAQVSTSAVGGALSSSSAGGSSASTSTRGWTDFNDDCSPWRSWNWYHVSDWKCGGGSG